MYKRGMQQILWWQTHTYTHTQRQNNYHNSATHPPVFIKTVFRRNVQCTCITILMLLLATIHACVLFASPSLITVSLEMIYIWTYHISFNNLEPPQNTRKAVSSSMQHTLSIQSLQHKNFSKLQQKSLKMSPTLYSFSLSLIPWWNGLFNLNRRTWFVW